MTLTITRIIRMKKESYIVTFNQYLESLRLNTYVSLARNTYWDASSNVNYSLSLSRDFDIGPLKNVSTSLTFSRINWEEDNQGSTVPKYFDSPGEPVEH